MCVPLPLKKRHAFFKKMLEDCNKQKNLPQRLDPNFLYKTEGTRDMSTYK